LINIFCRNESPKTGTDVKIFKIFFAEEFGEKMAFLLKLLLVKKKFIITLVLDKNAIFSLKIVKKTQKSVIITSTPGIFHPLRKKQS
jgi:hypothetical protein